MQPKKQDANVVTFGTLLNNPDGTVVNVNTDAKVFENVVAFVEYWNISAGIDVILVGDSASNVMAGHETTLPITLDHMIYHASSVVRAIDRALVVVDLPFGTYQSDSKEALSSAIRIMKESGGHAVKLEGGKEIKLHGFVVVHY